MPSAEARAAASPIASGMPSSRRLIATIIAIGRRSGAKCGSATTAFDTEGLLESRSDLRLLDQLIEALPAPLREMIVLRELHELGYREIAEVTGVPIGTVMSRLHRARSLLLRAHHQTGGAAART